MKKNKSSKNNHYRWQELTACTEFLYDLIIFQKKYNLPVKKLGSNYQKLIDSKKFKEADLIIDKVTKARVDFINKLKKEGKFDEFWQGVEKLLDKYNLGIGWFICILDFLISFFIMTPHYNLLFYKREGMMVIELNPNTSLDDIKEAWPEIKEELKKMYTPNKRRQLYYSKKKIENIELMIKDWRERAKEELSPTTCYDTESDKNVEYKLKDSDIIDRIFADEYLTTKENRKRLLKLRIKKSQAKKNYRN